MLRHFACILLLLFACGCDRTGANPAPIEKVNVVATVYPLADLARQVGGPYVNVSWILESGQSVSGLQSSPELRNRLRDADLVLAGGATEPWAVEASSNVYQFKRIIRLDALSSAQESIDSGGYVWLDPLIAEEGCRELCARLTAQRPERQEALRHRADDYVASLEGLLTEYRPKFSAIQNKRAVVLNPQFNALLSRFNFDVIQPLNTTAMQLDDSAIAVLRRTASQRNCKLLLVSGDTPAVVIDDVTVRTGMQLIALDALGTSAPGGRNSYLEQMRYNLEQLYHAVSVR